MSRESTMLNYLTNDWLYFEKVVINRPISAALKVQKCDFHLSVIWPTELIPVECLHPKLLKLLAYF